MPRKKKEEKTEITKAVKTKKGSKKGKKQKVLLIDSEGGLITLAKLPKKIPIFPLYQRPMFPGLLTMVGCDAELGNWLIKALEKTNQIAGLLMVEPREENDEKSEIQDPNESDNYYIIGTIAYVLHWVELPDQNYQFMMSTLQRFRVNKLLPQKNGFNLAEVEYPEDEKLEITDEIKARAAAIIAAIKELIPHNPIFTQEMNYLLSQADVNEPANLADLAASVTNAQGKALQGILETFGLQERMERTLLLLREEYDLSLLKEKINQKIEDKITKNQREFFLREQLKAIKVELGIEQERKDVELTRFKERFENLPLTQETKEHIQKELERYELLDDQSPEFHIVHQYLEWLASLPWGVFSKDRLSLTNAQKVLDEDHYGLDDVKKRILEFIGVSKLKGGVKGAILCLVGPPGVGKTSLGKSIARALEREFYRFSVGGMQDETEIKGHRRTYVGALPGRLVHALRQVKTSNPVIMLDELDKVGTSYRGDPFSVLLEVLDPEQNKDFLDHYLDVRFDLSNVLFIATANVLDTIPAPLLDRMEVLHLSGYIMEEKIEIAQKYLLPKLISDNGLTSEKVAFQKDALTRIILDYAREAGVRGLEKQIRSILRAIATKFARGRKLKETITKDNVLSYLGAPKYTEEEYHKKAISGVTRGLAWTSFGGSVLLIESASLSGNGGALKLTGQLGDVMKESSKIAHSYAQHILKKINIQKKYFQKNSIHLHVPSGATPKDGPSAGIAMATSMLSLALNKPVSAKIAMTGELTLTGYVLPVGGIKEKVVGARLGKIDTIIFPKDNKRDFEELPDHLKKNLNVYFVSHYYEVAKLAIEIDVENVKPITDKEHIPNIK